MYPAIDVQANLAGPTDLAGFRSEARQLLAHQVPPENVHWALEDAPGGGYGAAVPAQASRPRHVARAATAIVPASFARLCEFVVMHRDPERFALLYRLLWRLVHEPGLRNDPIDADMLQAQHMAHAVRRDIHKMKTTLQLRPVLGADGEPLQVGCHEPTHHVVEATAPWFAKRAAATAWAIFTPDRSVHWNRQDLRFGPGVPPSSLPAPEADAAAWLACHARVFAAGGGDGATLHA